MPSLAARTAAVTYAWCRCRRSAWQRIVVSESPAEGAPSLRLRARRRRRSSRSDSMAMNRRSAGIHHQLDERPTLRHVVYFARLQITVPTPPLDAVGVMYFSSSWSRDEISRFCSVAFQLGNVALSTLKVSVLSGTLNE